MLYDPKWSLSLAGLIAWLETQPGGQQYDFNNCSGGCLFSQYLRAITGTHQFGDGSYSEFIEVVPQHIASSRPYTFGAALKRARAALTEGLR